MELYKVVDIESRYGSNWAMFKESFLDQNSERYNEGRRFRDNHPELFPQYLKGSKLQALHETLGFMLFEKEWQADTFMQHNFVFPSNVEIIRVVALDTPINRNYDEACIIHGCGLHITNLEYAKMVNEKQGIFEEFDMNSGITFGRSTISFVTAYRIVVLD